MHIKLIANRAGGRGGKRVIERVCAYLTERGNTVDTFLTGKRGDALKAAREAREGRVNLIIAAGGDGTINEVVNGLAGSSIPARAQGCLSPYEMQTDSKFVSPAIRDMRERHKEGYSVLPLPAR